MRETQGVIIQSGSDGFASTLFISKLDTSSNGNYTCRAKNVKGVDEKHGVLYVKGNNSFQILSFELLVL